MHRPDSLIVAFGKRIRSQHILRIVVAYLKQTVIFAFFRLPGADALRYLRIELFILLRCYEIDLAVVCLKSGCEKSKAKNGGALKKRRKIAQVFLPVQKKCPAFFVQNSQKIKN